MSSNQCAACGQWSGRAHKCPPQAVPQPTTHANPYLERHEALHAVREHAGERIARAKAALNGPAGPHLDPQWAGALADGYTSEDINEFFNHVYEKTGVELICVWDYYDEYGFGGDSQWYAGDFSEGRASLRDLNGDLYTWVSTPSDDPDAVDGPGDPATWKGAPADLGIARPQEWDGYNWAVVSNDPTR